MLHNDQLLTMTMCFQMDLDDLFQLDGDGGIRERQRSEDKKPDVIMEGMLSIQVVTCKKFG